MANDYTTLSGIKALMPANTWGTTYDSLLTSMITRASRQVDAYLKREAGWFAVSATSTKYFEGSGKPELWIGELAATPTAVLVAESGDVDDASGTGGTYTTWATSDYVTYPYNAPTSLGPILRLDIDALNGSKSIWYKFPKAVKITGYWGYATTSNTPDIIKHATEILTMKKFMRAQQGFTVKSSKEALASKYDYGFMDPEVQELLDSAEFQWLF